MWNARLDKTQAGIKISGKNINSLGYADDITLMAENEEEVTPLDERGEWKTGLKLNIKKTKIMACGPITSNRWQIAGETMETVTDLIFLGFKITADGDSNHEIKRRLLLGRKSYDQPRQCIKKQRHYFVYKSPSSQSYDFPSSHVRMWELGHKESWALKNWCFWTMVLEKTFEGPLGCKEIKPVNPKGN